MAHSPRSVLRVDLAALERDSGGSDARAVLRQPWNSAEPALERIGSWGGGALALALLAERDPSDVRLLISAGDAVRRGLPTAARAAVLARSPLTGRVAAGQVGGDLGTNLATLTDVLELSGRTRLAGAVLFLRGDGRVELVSRPELVGLDPVETWRRLGTAGALLTIGLAGERRLPFATLASGGERPSFVGRGGLGAIFGELGLKALVVERGELAVRDDDGRRSLAELSIALSRSPRLAQRAEGGTLELYAAHGARGDLFADGGSRAVEQPDVQALTDEIEAAKVERKGCRGCPTPCGWVFERSDGSRQRAHFSASHALGLNLGLEEFDDALALLARCDALGADAREVGACLAIRATAIERGRLSENTLFGQRDRLLRAIDALVEDSAVGARVTADALARELGVENASVSIDGQAARDEASYASVLGQCVSTGGSDPMRSFPFLIEAAGHAGLERLCADLGPLPRESAEPTAATAKGRLVYWHENLVSAVDATGFCAFSTAGLLADAVVSVDELAEWILPPELAQPADAAWRALPAGLRLLAAGANLVLLRHRLDRAVLSRASTKTILTVPEWARARLDEPGMLDEYRDWRGLDAAGFVTAERAQALGTPRVLRPAVRSTPASATPASATPASATPPREHAQAAPLPGRVELRGIEGGFSVELPLPASMLDVLRSAAEEHPALAPRLLANGRPIPSVWRSGSRLEPDADVRAGDVLDLVTAISGG